MTTPEKLTRDQQAAADRLMDRLADRGVKRPRIVSVRDPQGVMTGWVAPDSGDWSSVTRR